MRINSPETNDLALLIMDILIENYDKNIMAIDVLWQEIENYEETALEFEEFNSRFK
jgi:HTH-type transcriptional regulator/antitoxin HigA